MKKQDRKYASAMCKVSPLTERLRSGRRWINVQDPAEASALAAGYAALLRAFPSAAGGVECGGMAPLDELTAAVRRVAETWSRSQPQRAAQDSGTVLAAEHGISPAGTARRSTARGRGRPLRLGRKLRSARPDRRPSSPEPSPPPPPPPPPADAVTPSAPLCLSSAPDDFGDDCAAGSECGGFDGGGMGWEDAAALDRAGGSGDEDDWAGVVDSSLPGEAGQDWRNPD